MTDDKLKEPNEDRFVWHPGQIRVTKSPQPTKKSKQARR